MANVFVHALSRLSMIMNLILAPNQTAFASFVRLKMEFEEILSYSKLMDSLESQEDGEGNVWKFHCITGHQGPLLHYDKDYNGSLYNVMIICTDN